MKPPKKPRPIPPERFCPTRDCGARMEFTHSWPTAKGVSKRRHCPFCGRVDRVLLRIEVEDIVVIAERALRTNKSAKKTSGKVANKQITTPPRARRTKHSGDNESKETDHAR